MRSKPVLVLFNAWVIANGRDVSLQYSRTRKQLVFTVYLYTMNSFASSVLELNFA